MGYSHYWCYKQKATVEQIKTVLSEIRLFENDFDTRFIIDGYDTSAIQEAKIDEVQIAFTNIYSERNVDNSNDLFFLNFNKIVEFNCCKSTRNTTYDKMLCLILMSLIRHFDGFYISSELNLEGWIEIFMLYKRIIGVNDALNISLDKFTF